MAFWHKHDRNNKLLEFLTRRIVADVNAKTFRHLYTPLTDYDKKFNNQHHNQTHML